ncbi:hypothetical protein [Vibrio fluvialis]|uniref:hypothetical protein n=1 Tax=Vibrio fluvialis TaxID=676 RepID=UPI001EEC4503|nr:hypothetical protein [Vibrio fluvialis]MCG6350605.1 hypothetical protein [Vibrio fluvialis]
MSVLKKEMRSNRSNWNFRWLIDEEIKRFEEQIGGKLSKEETLDFLFGNHSDRARTMLNLYLLEEPEKTVFHRLNHLWAFPLTFVLAPFRYVLYGDIGWDNKTRLGRFMLKSCGFHKDL